jgi:hypothetical protein
MSSVPFKASICNAVEAPQPLEDNSVSSAHAHGYPEGIQGLPAQRLSVNEHSFSSAGAWNETDDVDEFVQLARARDYPEGVDDLPAKRLAERRSHPAIDMHEIDDRYGYDILKEPEYVPSSRANAALLRRHMQRQQQDAQRSSFQAPTGASVLPGRLESQHPRRAGEIQRDNFSSTAYLEHPSNAHFDQSVSVSVQLPLALSIPILDTFSAPSSQ